MLTLKHLAQKYQLDPYRLRQHLRKHLKHPTYNRWQWDPQDPQLSQAHKLAKELSDGTKTR